MVNLLTRAFAMVGGLKIADHDYGVIEVANKTGVSIAAGKMVYISGFDATLNKPTITLADKDTSAKVAQFITKNAIAANKTGYVYEKMILTGQNTNGGNVGDPVYLGDSGAWTLSAPTGADMIQQIVGFITVKSATVGKILFLLTPRNVVVIGTSGLQGDSITTAKVPASTVTKTKLVGGFSKVTLAAGTNSGANVTIAGIAVGDEVVAVLSFTTAAAIATVADRTAEYVAGAGVLTKAAGTDDRNNQLVVFWNDLT